MTEVIFFVFGAFTLGCAINVIVQRHVLYSALSLIMMLGGIAGLFVLLQAELLAVVQIIVYTGAIMVLFVFVIMLLNVPTESQSPDPLRWLKFIGIPAGLFLLSLISSSIWQNRDMSTTGAVQGAPDAIGRSLFTDYVLPFEATSVLILVAIVGSLVLAKREL